MIALLATDRGSLLRGHLLCVGLSWWRMTRSGLQLIGWCQRAGRQIRVSRGGLRPPRVDAGGCSPRACRQPSGSLPRCFISAPERLYLSADIRLSPICVQMANTPGSFVLLRRPAARRRTASASSVASATRMRPRPRLARWRAASGERSRTAPSGSMRRGRRSSRFRGAGGLPLEHCKRKGDE